MLTLAGKTILVTGGAGTGVGGGVCQAVALAGGRIVLNDLTEVAVTAACARYPDAVGLVGSVADHAHVEQMFAALAAQGIVLDGLVNSAGIGLSKPAHEISPDEYDHLHGVDLRGVWLMTRAFVRHVRHHGRASASIVNISSVHAHSTMNRYAVYASAKAGVEGLTRGLAVELGPSNIRCNAVAPGYVHSEQNESLLHTWTDDPMAWVEQHSVNQQALEFVIEPIDCGYLVAFLLSDLSRAITGQVIRVDAGKTAMLYNKDFL
jgi:NAD(P)-dependent dehydrogenase (short-subunit alcohol dehydrogenase family)